MSAVVVRPQRPDDALLRLEDVCMVAIPMRTPAVARLRSAAVATGPAFVVAVDVSLRLSLLPSFWRNHISIAS